MKRLDVNFEGDVSWVPEVRLRVYLENEDSDNYLEDKESSVESFRRLRKKLGRKIDYSVFRQLCEERGIDSEEAHSFDKLGTKRDILNNSGNPVLYGKGGLPVNVYEVRAAVLSAAFGNVYDRAYRNAGNMKMQSSNPSSLKEECERVSPERCKNLFALMREAAK